MPYSVQHPDQPLYPGLFWNKPETKALSGKMLIIGGNVHSISAPSAAYSLANKAGAGEVRVVMPGATKRYFAGSSVPPEIVFAASTPSGSFSTQALDELLSYIGWTDYVCIAGDTSSNSETAVLLNKLVTKIVVPLSISGDALENLTPEASTVLSRSNTLLVPTFAQLQKYVTATHYKTALTSTMPIKVMTDWLTDFTTAYPVQLLFTLNNAAYAAHAGEVIITRPIPVASHWELPATVHASVWTMHHPTNTLQAIASSLAQPPSN